MCPSDAQSYSPVNRIDHISFFFCCKTVLRMILGIAPTTTKLPEEALLEVFGRSVASPYMFLAAVWSGLVDVQLREKIN